MTFFCFFVCLRLELDFSRNFFSVSGQELDFVPFLGTWASPNFFD